jgi:predicted phage baseplate assembly protein
MSLPAPSLDERRFQDIVDEAKRLIPRYCPEWTDHNVSDPGVALIELFAWMTEMIIYRLNQVPDVLYTRFLELMGIRLFPAVPAKADVTFWLAGPQPEPVLIPAGARVGTVRTEFEDSIGFATENELRIVQPELTACLTAAADGRYEDHWDDLRIPGEEVVCFPTSRPGDAIYFGFEKGLSGNVLRLDVDASTPKGRGIRPDDPPWAWDAWDGSDWARVKVYQDETGGFNTAGAIMLMLPPRHEVLALGPTRACWVRCVMRPGSDESPTYEESPRIRDLEVTGLGGTATAHHAEAVPTETVGRSDGTPGQVFHLRRSPVLPRREGETVRVATQDGASTWAEVDSFARSGPEDLHFRWDGAAGVIEFGPEVRYPDGRRAQYGAIPPIGAEIQVTGYRVGGGVRGNVGAGTISVMKSSIPFIGRVENLEAARGGVEAEDVANARIRGPLSLRTGERAVTADDFTRIALESTPLVARARCLPPIEPGGPVRLLTVPRLDVAPEHLVLDDLILDEGLLNIMAPYVDERRILTTTVELIPPSYQGITVVARVRGAPGGNPEIVRDAALDALFRYINPLVGGPEGEGWPFDRELNVGEVFALLSGIEGVVGVEDVRIFLADLRTGQRSKDWKQRVGLPEDALFASFQHQVQVR